MNKVLQNDLEAANSRIGRLNHKLEEQNKELFRISCRKKEIEQAHKQQVLIIVEQEFALELFRSRDKAASWVEDQARQASRNTAQEQTTFY